MERSYTLRVCGNECTIISDEPEAVVLRVVAKVEGRIKEIFNENTKVSIGLAGILASMGFCEEAERFFSTNENLTKQINKYVADIEDLTSRNEQLQADKERLQKQIEALRARL